MCGRGYTICAPVDLCWTCNVMDLPPMVNSTAGGDSKFVAGIIIPGMRLQPFNNVKGNSTVTKTAK